ncbi:hypothetical protein PsorP6_011314 [Peronosclerospora sorghi]|uniref:Uncharacterized protein n=1 Tax=Peronosclerospora sorghi TaxID=230839 RepID=A0ACC0WJY5_9STRA|nr:hypothetical protein PsorP6_011314 [Peronosclerospora sorghi]
MGFGPLASTRNTRYHRAFPWNTAWTTTGTRHLCHRMCSNEPEQLLDVDLTAAWYTVWKSVCSSREFRVFPL